LKSRKYFTTPFKITYNVCKELAMANEIGKRYVCKKCGSEFLVTKPGPGTLKCCGEPMEQKK